MARFSLCKEVLRPRASSRLEISPDCRPCLRADMDRSEGARQRKDPIPAFVTFCTMVQAPQEADIRSTTEAYFELQTCLFWQAFCHEYRLADK